MKEKQFRPRSACSRCKIAFVIGPPTSAEEHAEERGLKQVAFLHVEKLDGADGVYLGCLISPETDLCPRCKAPIGEEFEVEVPDHCGLCPGPVDVSWLISDTTYVGLCHSCNRSQRAENWLEQQRARHLP